MIENQDKINRLITKYIGKKALLDIFLYELKSINGFLNAEILEYVAQITKFRLSLLYEYAEFFNLYGTNPRKTIEISYSANNYQSAEKIIRYLKSFFGNSSLKPIFVKNFRKDCIDSVYIKIGSLIFTNVTMQTLKESVLKKIKRELG